MELELPLLLGDVGQKGLLAHIEHAGRWREHGRVWHKEAARLHQVTGRRAEDRQLVLGHQMVARRNASTRGYCTIVFDFDYGVVEGGWQQVRIQG